MKTFFHAYTKEYSKKCKKWTIIVTAPLLQLSVVAFFVLFFNFRRVFDSDFALPIFIFGIISVSLSVVVVWIGFAVTVNRIKRHSRYSFCHIMPQCVVFSFYSGETRNGGKTILRKLYLVKYKNLSNIYIDKKTKKLILLGEIREYFPQITDRLYYEIAPENGKLRFENWWLNENGFKQLEKADISSEFEQRNLMVKNILAAKESFLNAPKPKKYIHQEPEIIIKKYKPRYNNKFSN